MKPPSIPSTGLLTLALLALLIALPAQAARIALVVGNAAYSDGPLKNPVNDARAVQAKLTRLGFEVTQVENLKRRDIGRTVNSFASRIRPGDEVVVFYAGHGVQVKGINYLPAVDADIQSEEDVPLNSLNLGNLLERLDEAKAGVKILLLDACRNNPYARSFRSGTRGLARVQDAPSGTLMHFATRPGSVAADGTGSNGLYTTELLRHIDQPGMPIEQMLKRVSAAVDKASKGQQEPWTEGSLRGDFYFQPGAGMQVASVMPLPAGQPIQTDGEAAAWEIAQRANNAAVYTTFLSEYPQGRFARAARIALSELRSNASTPMEGSAATSMQEIVKIGHVGPISGVQSHYGKDNENGARMAIDELNIRGISIGGKKIRFELQAEDDGADPKRGSAVAQKLCDARVAGVVGHLNSGTTIPASKIYNDCGIPHVTGSATNPNLTKPGYNTTFRLVADDNALGSLLAHYAADILRLQAVAIVDDRTAFGAGVAAAFKSAAISKGLTVVDEQFTTDRSTDFSAILTAIKSKNPQAIFFGGMDTQAGPMLSQMEQLGMRHIRYLGTDGICTSELARLAAGTQALSNVICGEGLVLPSQMPRGAEWKAKYDAKYPGQFQIYSPYTYDATMLLVDAMQRADSWNPRVYASEIAKAQYDGVTGRISFTTNGEPIKPAITMYAYKNGRKTRINQ